MQINYAYDKYVYHFTSWSLGSNKTFHLYDTPVISRKIETQKRCGTEYERESHEKNRKRLYVGRRFSCLSFFWGSSKMETSHFSSHHWRQKTNIQNKWKFRLYHTMIIWLMLYREIATIYYGNHKEHGGKMQKSFKVKLSGKHTNHKIVLKISLLSP